jgi:hypothetical protein
MERGRRGFWVATGHGRRQAKFHACCGNSHDTFLWR